MTHLVSKTEPNQNMRVTTYMSLVIALLFPVIAKAEPTVKTIMHSPDHVDCNSGGGETCHIGAAMDAEHGFIICQVLGSISGGRSIGGGKEKINPMPGRERVAAHNYEGATRYNGARWWGWADSAMVSGVSGVGIAMYIGPGLVSGRSMKTLRIRSVGNITARCKVVSLHG